MEERRVKKKREKYLHSGPVNAGLPSMDMHMHAISLEH